MTQNAARAEETSANLDSERLLPVLSLMWKIRLFEETAIEAQREGLVLGAIHPSIGQEAVAAGICPNLRQADLLLSTHRGHGHTLAKGADPLAMMMELFGRAEGTCGGKGGSMHIADFGVGMLGANGVVGANITIGVGAAHALKMRRSDDIAVCIFGDGAINRGPFLEGLNWARVYDLPVLFVCEDNGFSATTRTRTLTGGPGAVARAESLGLPAEEVDGNDVLGVDAAARTAIDAIRQGGGPRFLQCRTYRMTGHTAVDPATYRDAAEVEEWRAHCPIARLEGALRLAGVDEARMQQQRTEAEQYMQDVYARARDAEWPDPAQAFADVQDIGNPAERAY
ncbi:acetoin dehydrogenase (TPP-dependent) alpha chain [Pseudooceanicola batsensis HTCC2597]|uniref:Acetoin dehydrogenase (TPP-dependent) alpha chain n=1 Tax=Pseudooceanicola batsensis (strain ATCC BAA-863 / DSM 15984 / KCTC 12145 / HTCC2597) TaxID=252305 RepID=A3U0V2_PSEBH|nr:thiamine pyrophosphate-dependent dehydrogenase E1 component subunit alpha [Pseudooceanicola batsensis]EAQ02393.1 acetoin dehydrogenase (TPP-dependent) alpha chain [Pseudooceanicola batsensis HTCC2597]